MFSEYEASAAIRSAVSENERYEMLYAKMAEDAYSDMERRKIEAAYEAKYNALRYEESDYAYAY